MIESLASGKLFWVIVIALGALGVGTALRLTALRGRTDEYAVGRRNSLKTWWAVMILAVGIVVVGRSAAAVAFALISWLGFLEFTRLKRLDDRGQLRAELKSTTLPPWMRWAPSAVLPASILIPIHYLCLWWSPSPVMLAVLPLGLLMLTSAGMVLAGRAKSYLSQLGHTYLGFMFTTYLLSHVVLLFPSSPSAESRLDQSAWFIFVVLLTEVDDIVQALVGRRIGKRRLSPIISPNKTWEGFFGGLVVTVLLSILLGRFLVSVAWPQSIGYGIMVAAVALFGDLNISAVKRDAGVKDSGHWLPGHGGILDRIDSLTFTAPAVYYVCLPSVPT